MGNALETGLRLASLMALLVLIGDPLGGRQGMAVALVPAGVMSGSPTTPSGAVQSGKACH